MKTLTLSAAAAAAVLLATPALADPVEWTISGTFEDGGTISGTYVYDYDTLTYSQIDITTTAGTAPSPILTSGATYTGLRGGGGSNAFEALEGGTTDGERVLSVWLNGSMNMPGTYSLNTALTAEGTCSGGACQGAYGTPRELVSGSVTGVPLVAAPVPTMTEWAMIGLTGLLALAGAVMVGRRRFV